MKKGWRQVAKKRTYRDCTKAAKETSSDSGMHDRAITVLHE